VSTHGTNGDGSNNGSAADGSPLAAALAYRSAGLSIVPVRAYGSKRPALNQWERFQQEPPPEDLVRSWWKDGTAGIGVIGGAVSGNLETIDFDRDDLFEPWRELVEAQAPGLVARLCIVRTPREPSGYHVRYRCHAVTVPGNMKLAQEPGTDPKTGKPRVETLIETRGEGGYALAPGSPAACHSSGRTWDHVAGPPLTELPDITAGEREILIAAARSFDLAEAARMKRPESGTKDGTAGAGLRPGDDYDRRGPDWPAILEPHGWKRVQSQGATTYWRRPGKEAPGFSATTGFCKGAEGVDLLAVFSSNAHPFHGPSGARPCSLHSKFGAYALLNHGGDLKAAAELAREGYGETRQQPAWPDPIPLGNCPTSPRSRSMSCLAP
jgi:putative DNA primase/helicase